MPTLATCRFILVLTFASPAVVHPMAVSEGTHVEASPPVSGYSRLYGPILDGKGENILTAAIGNGSRVHRLALRGSYGSHCHSIPSSISPVVARGV